MIFGFNTEVVFGSASYHLQSEFRARERLLQTQVFVSGQCIGKVANVAGTELGDAECEKELREQHRAAVAAARDGKIKEWLNGSAQPDDGKSSALV